METLVPRTGSNRLVSVTLAEFASLAGLTADEYSTRLFDRLVEGRMLDIFRMETQCHLSEWISRHCLDNQREFIVMIRLSANMSRDVCLWCVCQIDMEGDEAKIAVRTAVPGFVDIRPLEAEGDMCYSVEMSELETSL